MLVLLDVDTQNDLVQSWGRYSIQGANQLLQKLQTITGFVKDNRNSLHIAFKKVNFYGQEKRSGDNEGKIYPSDNEPRHCEKGTTGVNKVEESMSSNRSNGVSINPRMPYPSITDFISTKSHPVKPYLFIEHAEWDVFSNERTEEVLRKLASADKEVKFVVYGVPGDKTLQSLLLGMQKRKIPGEIFLLEDAICSYDQRKQSEILKGLATKVGAHLTNINSLLNTGFKGIDKKRKLIKKAAKGKMKVASKPTGKAAAKAVTSEASKSAGEK